MSYSNLNMVVEPPAPYSSTVMLGLSSRQISRTPSSSIQTDLGRIIAQHSNNSFILIHDSNLPN